jgi:hypothetical protein
VVSDEFAFDKVRNRKWTHLINRPDDLEFFPAGANPASIGEVIVWGYVCDLMSLREKANWLFL